MHYAMKVTAIALILLNGVWFGSVPAMANPSAQELVQQTSERMIAAINAEHDAIKQNPERLYALVEEIILPHFDFERMSSKVDAMEAENQLGEELTGRTAESLVAERKLGDMSESLKLDDALAALKKKLQG